jgi:hypothetical protein
VLSPCARPSSASRRIATSEPRLTVTMAASAAALSARRQMKTCSYASIRSPTQLWQAAGLNQRPLDPRNASVPSPPGRRRVVPVEGRYRRAGSSPREPLRALAVPIAFPAWTLRLRLRQAAASGVHRGFRQRPGRHLSWARRWSCGIRGPADAEPAAGQRSERGAPAGPG